MSPHILLPELSYRITGICFQVHNELGRFAKERQYADRIEQLLRSKSILFRREAKIPFITATEKISGNVADFIIEEKLILECKAKLAITREDYQQTQRYLQAAQIELGMLVNFHMRFLVPKRILNYSLHKITYS